MRGMRALKYGDSLGDAEVSSCQWSPGFIEDVIQENRRLPEAKGLQNL